MSMETNNIQTVKQEHAEFIQHIEAIEYIERVYMVEDMGSESLELEYIIKIGQHCEELRRLIDKLYETNAQMNELIAYRQQMR